MYVNPKPLLSFPGEVGKFLGNGVTDDHVRQLVRTLRIEVQNVDGQEVVATAALQHFWKRDHCVSALRKIQRASAPREFQSRKDPNKRYLSLAQAAAETTARNPSLPTIAASTLATFAGELPLLRDVDGSEWIESLSFVRWLKHENGLKKLLTAQRAADALAEEEEFQSARAAGIAEAAHVSAATDEQERFQEQRRRYNNA